MVDKADKQQNNHQHTKSSLSQRSKVYRTLMIRCSTEHPAHPVAHQLPSQLSSRARAHTLGRVDMNVGRKVVGFVAASECQSVSRETVTAARSHPDIIGNRMWSPGCV